MPTLFKLANEGSVNTCPVCQLLLAQTDFFPQFSQLCRERFCQGGILDFCHSLTIRECQNIVHGKYAPEYTHAM